jgi:hypothetical protein
LEPDFFKSCVKYADSARLGKYAMVVNGHLIFLQFALL